MAKNSKEFIGETEKLKIENEALRQQLEEAKVSIDSIKRGNIDALVITREKDLKVYTEKTADKPYRILIEKMHEGAVTLNKDGSIIYCNSSFAKMVNLPLQKITGTKIEKYMDESFKGYFAKWLNPGGVNALQEESYIYAHGGKMLPVLMTVTALTLDELFVLNIILTDLTVQKETQERLKVKSKQIEEKNKELENTNKELAYQNEEKEKRAAELVIANKELAYQNEEKDKRAAELSIADKELKYQSGEKEKRAAELSIADKELKFQSGEKEKRAAELIVANIELAYQNEEKDKRAAELIIVETDVKELVGLNTHKERILSTIAHDLRSPLAGIIQTVELLREDFETMDALELKDRLNLLYNLSIDELNMLDSLVDWARIKFASEAFTPANIELVKYMKKVFATFNEIAVANGIHLSYEIEENIIVFADKKMLLSILQNIVSNSIKNTHSGGKVIASAKRTDDKIMVEIRDTGIGMSQEIKDKLFEPQMEDLSKARKEKKGAGIGLLLIKGFVSKNRGEIRVESIEGEGTSFYFTLPVGKPLE